MELQKAMKTPAIFLKCENCGKKIDINDTIYPVQVFLEKCDRTYPHIAPCCCADCAEELIEKQLDRLYMDFKTIQSQKIVSMDCKKYIGGVGKPDSQNASQSHTKQANPSKRNGSVTKKIFQRGFSKLPSRRT